MLASANTNFTDICTIKSPCVPLKCSIEGIWFADIKHKRKLLKESKKFRAELSVHVDDAMGEVEMDEVILLEEGPVEMDEELNGLHLHLPMDVYTIEDKEVVMPDDDPEEQEEEQPEEEPAEQHAEQQAEQQEQVNYLTTDPAQLLKSLSPMLGAKGEIRDISEVPAMTKLMKAAEKLVTKCVYSNILRATSDAAVLAAFVSAGGWDILNDWLQEAKTEVNDAFLRELLKVYSQIPITVSLLKQNACAKTIKQLSKSDTAGLKSLAAEIVDRWMSTVRQASESSSSSEKSKKRKHSHKEKDRSEKDKKSSSKDPSKDSNGKSSPELKTKSRISPERDAAPASPPSSTKPEPSKPRPKTVKMVPTKFRSTGLEQETILPPTKMKGALDKDVKSLPLKRPSLTIPKPSPPEKKLRPSLPSPLPSATPSSTPIDKKGGVKFIAPRPKPVQVYESAGFMDALAPTLTVAGMRRKRKGSGSGKPGTPTSPPSKQPSVPSFYQDTMESAEDDKESDTGEGDDKENTEGGETENVAEGETTVEPTPPRKKRKKVSWAEDGNLKSFFYFELDEQERVNVNKHQDFAASMKNDMANEREAMGSHKRPAGGHEALIGGVMWRRPRLIKGLPEVTADKGCNSTEKKTQKEREQVMLQALYFSKSMIPDSAAEPDPEAYEPVDPKTIPLEDETGGVCETVFTKYPDPVEVMDIPMSTQVPPRSPGLSLHPDIAKMVANMAHQSQVNDRGPVAHDYGTMQHGQTQQYPAVATTGHNGNYNNQQFTKGNGMNVPPPPAGVHNMMNMTPPPGFPPNYAPPGYTDTSGPPPPYGHPPPLDRPPLDRPPPYGPPPPHMQGMHPRDEEWGENMHGGPMMGPGPRGPPPGMPPRGYGGGGMRRGPPGPPRGRGPHSGPPGPPRVCQHFMKGTCKFEKNCRHLHPGINGPRL